MVEAKAETRSESVDLASGLDLFMGGRYADFDRFLLSIPRPGRLEALKQMIDLSQQKFGSFDGMVVIRRVGQHAAFAPFFQSLPKLWDQGLFYANLPFLKTRVSVSFFEHPSMPRSEIDYTAAVIDQNGQVIATRNGTLRARQTHTFEVEKMIGDAPGFGTFLLQTSELDLHSLRIYAYWHNDNSMTTTHEKKALAHLGRLLIYPNIVCDEENETYLAICNGGEEPLGLKTFLLNRQEELHPNCLELKIPAKGTGFVPISHYFKDARAFLNGAPGAVKVENDSSKGLYYYFIQNTRLNTWQAQHL